MSNLALSYANLAGHTFNFIHKKTALDKMLNHTSIHTSEKSSKKLVNYSQYQPKNVKKGKF